MTILSIKVDLRVMINPTKDFMTMLNSAPEYSVAKLQLYSEFTQYTMRPKNFVCS